VIIINSHPYPIFIVIVAIKLYSGAVHLPALHPQANEIANSS
jgi:hypothetical protein